jgi:hypothetical protein
MFGDFRSSANRSVTLFALVGFDGDEQFGSALQRVAF